MYHSKGSMNEGIPEEGLYYFANHRPLLFVFNAFTYIGKER